MDLGLTGFRAPGPERETLWLFGGSDAAPQAYGSKGRQKSALWALTTSGSRRGSNLPEGTLGRFVKPFYAARIIGKVDPLRLI